MFHVWFELLGAAFIVLGMFLVRPSPVKRWAEGWISPRAVLRSRGIGVYAIAFGCLWIALVSTSWITGQT